MATKKRNAAAALLLEGIKLRSKFEKVVGLVEQLTGKSIKDGELASCMDCCYPVEKKPGMVEAMELLAKIERGEFSYVQPQRMKGNGGEQHA